jgi:hypothetical protein
MLLRAVGPPPTIAIGSGARDAGRDWVPGLRFSALLIAGVMFFVEGTPGREKSSASFEILVVGRSNASLGAAFTSLPLRTELGLRAIVSSESSSLELGRSSETDALLSRSGATRGGNGTFGFRIGIARGGACAPGRESPRGASGDPPSLEGGATDFGAPDSAIATTKLGSAQTKPGAPRVRSSPCGPHTIRRFGRARGNFGNR